MKFSDREALSTWIEQQFIAGWQQQVPALKCERFQVHIRAAAANGAEAFIRGFAVLRGVPDLQMHATHQAPKIVDVPLAKRGEIFAGDGFQIPLHRPAGSPLISW